jgi:RNA polymerase sigma-70 factor, ECF subfamily
MQNVLSFTAPGHANRAPISEPADDDVLIARIAAGDRLAMHLLFTRHYVAIYRFVLHRLRDAGLAEDVTSEVFLDVWRYAGRFEKRAKVMTWMLAIARHKAYAGGLRAKRMVSSDDFGEAEAGEDCDPFSILQTHNLSMIIGKCLSKLSER